MKTATKAAIAVPAMILAAAYAFIAPLEGEGKIGYLDIGGKVTACHGHTVTAVVGRKYTPEECMLLFQGDFAEAYGVLQRNVAVPLTANETVAYSSFIYNLGPRYFVQSQMLDHLNRGEHEKACRQILRWKFVGKKDCSIKANGCRGIWLRRQQEHALCMKDLPQ